MAMQTGKNVLVAYKAEATFNTAPGATGAKRLRITPGAGLALARADIRSAEVRSDGQRSMGRLGSKSVSGSYPFELSVGGFDDVLAAVMRGTWTAAITLDESDVTSITTTTSTIVATSGSWLSLGVRVGDIIRLSNHASAGNNDKNLRVTGVSATTITVAGAPLTANASPDTDFELTVARKLVNPSTPVRQSFTFEEVFQDIDSSALYTGCRMTQLRIVGNPDSTAAGEVTVVGADEQVFEDSSSPYFTSPSLTTRKPLTFVDAVIRFRDTDIGVLTGFDVTLALGGATLPVLGSVVTPDVFENDLEVSGTLTMARETLDNLKSVQDEDELSLHILLAEPGSEPKEFISMFIPRFNITSVSKQLGNEGAMIETVPFSAGKMESTTGYDDTTVTFCTSATA